MPAEAKRGCGYRKVGGRYLIGAAPSRPCGRFPIPLEVCPTCHGGIKQGRGWTWIRPAALLADVPTCDLWPTPGCGSCPMSDPARLADSKGRCGLLWVGGRFYPTPESFASEAARMGVCRRIAAIPRGIEIGKTWILLAHPKAIDGRKPGIFSAFVLTGIEQCVSEADFADEEAMDKLRTKGITPVPLPDEPAHRGSVFDKPDLIDEMRVH